MLRKHLLFVLGICMLLPLAMPAHAADDTWSTVSLTGYRVQTVTIDPSDSNRVYAGTDNGLLRSSDGGQTWQAIPGPFFSVYGISVDPTDSSHLFVADSSTLYQSTTDGDSWSEVPGSVFRNPTWVQAHPQDPAIVYVGAFDGLFRTADGGQSWSGAGLPVNGNVNSLAFDPSDPNVIYVTIQHEESLYRSEDGGQSWSVVVDIVDPLQVDVSPAGTAVVLTFDSIYTSQDRGRSWTNSPLHDYRYRMTTLAVDGEQPSTIYLAVENGILRSLDGGTTWIEQAQLFPRDADQLISVPGMQGHLYAIVGSQLYRSVDGGINWTGPSSSGGLTDLFVHPSRADLQFVINSDWYFGNGWRSLDGGQTWSNGLGSLAERYAHVFAFDPTNPDVIFAGTDAGLYRSSDSGTSWQPTGLPANVQVYGLAIDPQNSANLYVVSSDGFLRSTNSGESWTATAIGDGGTVQQVIVSPTQPQTLYALVNNELYHSQNSGVSWAMMVHPDRIIVAIATKPDDPQVLYSYASEGLYISRDGGRSWQVTTPVASGVATEVPSIYSRSGIALLTDPGRPDMLYAAFGPSIFVSPDTGRTWVAITEGSPELPVTSLVVTGEEPQKLYAIFDEGAGAVWQFTMQTPPQPPPTATATGTTTPVPIVTLTSTAASTPTSPTATTQLESATPIVLGTESRPTEENPTATVPAPAGDDDADELAPRSLVGIIILALLAMTGVVGGMLLLRRRPPKHFSSKVVCANCGAKNHGEAHFCSGCGHPLISNKEKFYK